MSNEFNACRRRFVSATAVVIAGAATSAFGHTRGAIEESGRPPIANHTGKRRDNERYKLIVQTLRRNAGGPTITTCSRSTVG